MFAKKITLKCWSEQSELKIYFPCAVDGNILLFGITFEEDWLLDKIEGKGNKITRIIIKFIQYLNV